MPKALVSYYSRTGNTKKMAARIAEVLVSQGLELDLKTVEDTAPADLLGYDCIVLGSPTYYGTMAWELKKLLDESAKIHGKLRGKVGGGRVLDRLQVHLEALRRKDFGDPGRHLHSISRPGMIGNQGFGHRIPPGTSTIMAKEGS